MLSNSRGRESSDPSPVNLGSGLSLAANDFNTATALARPAPDSSFPRRDRSARFPTRCAIDELWRAAATRAVRGELDRGLEDIGLRDSSGVEVSMGEGGAEVGGDQGLSLSGTCDKREEKF